MIVAIWRQGCTNVVTLGARNRYDFDR